MKIEFAGVRMISKSGLPEIGLGGSLITLFQYLWPVIQNLQITAARNVVGGVSLETDIAIVTLVLLACTIGLVGLFLFAIVIEHLIISMGKLALDYYDKYYRGWL